MNINPKYLEISYEKTGIRNSQKRLTELIEDTVVEQLKEFQDELVYQLLLVQGIIEKRVALVISHWCLHKDNPVKPDADTLMSDITSSNNTDVTLEEYYEDQVQNSLYALAPLFGLELPDTLNISTDELEYALLELEEKYDEMYSKKAAPLEEEEEELEEIEAKPDVLKVFETPKPETKKPNEERKPAPVMKKAEEERKAPEVRSFSFNAMPETRKEERVEVDTMPEFKGFAAVASVAEEAAEVVDAVEDEKSIVISQPREVQKPQEQEVVVNSLNLSAERAWQLVYGLIGWNTEYIQGQMLPRWQQSPDTFDNDRRFLYKTFLDTIRNAAGSPTIAGHYTFSDRPMTVDQLWNYYYTDLSRNVGSLLTQARLQAAVNDPWWKKMLQSWVADLKKVEFFWLLGLPIALIFDAWTTLTALDQTPMEGAMVWIFTVLITILFQIADMLVISYRKREFEADGLEAKYKAIFERINKTLDGLSPTSDSFVQLSMERSQAVADWKAAEDSRKMARRGRFWSGRIADINIVVTAYGFAYMLLNNTEPIYALFQQIEFIRLGMWHGLNIWVFLMIAMATTISFVINTLQRTEILGWSMRRLKNAG